MKAEWQASTLGNVCKLISGRHIDAKDYNFQSRGIGYLTGPSDFGPLHPIVTKWTEHPIITAKQGDILITVKGSGVGKINLLDIGEVAISRQLMAVRITGADPKFLHLFLSSTFDHFQSLSQGAAIPGISREHVLDLPIPLPPLPEQRRIVGILDEAFEGIATAKANAEKNLQNARALFESHLQSVFTQRGDGWAEKRLDEIGTTQTGSTPKTSDKGNFGSFIPFVKPADFSKDGTLDYENDALSEAGLKSARRVASNSVLMVCIGATIGKCGFCDRDVTTNQQINALTPTNGVSCKFIFYQMLTEDFQRRVIDSSSQMTLPIINKAKWTALTVTVPQNLREQQGIVTSLDALSEETQLLESIYQRKLAALDDLKKSLLHQAFSGEL